MAFCNMPPHTEIMPKLFRIDINTIFGICHILLHFTAQHNTNAPQRHNVMLLQIELCNKYCLRQSYEVQKIIV